MARSRLGRPTDSELEILRVLWERGPSTVREVHEQLSETKGGGYTTVLKLMQIMNEKGLVVREETPRANAHVYRAAAAREQTQRQLVRDLLDRAFSGSARALVLQALSAERSTPEEIAEIRTLLDELERRDQNGNDGGRR